MRSCYFRHGRLACPVRRYGVRSRKPDDVGVASRALFEGGDAERSIGRSASRRLPKIALYLNPQPGNDAGSSLPFSGRSQMTYLTPDENAGTVRSGLARTNVRFRSASIGPAALVRTVLCATP